MFLLGISASMLPYLLLAGIILVLTFGTSAEAFANTELIQTESHTITYQTTGNDEIINNTYQFANHFKNNFENELYTEIEIKTIIPISCINSSPGKHITQPIYSSGFFTAYFGLSPPQKS